MGEFEIIARYFRPLTNGDALQDDAAVIAIPDGYELVVSSDTLNAGTHFLADESPENIAHKALRVNLSDLAAMGARPLCYQLNLAFPKPPDDMWLGAFTGALLADQKTYGIYCSGGDTTGILGDYLSISITVMGLIPMGKALHRKGAREGDLVMVTGGVGDAFLGFKALVKGYDYPEAIMRYRRPQPRLESVGLLDNIHAAADISDGFMADLNHICIASGVGAQIDLARFHFSNEIMDAFDRGVCTPAQALSGGDDYELVMAVAPQDEKEIRKIFPAALTIGLFKAGQGVYVYGGNNQPVHFPSTGWTHF